MERHGTYISLLAALILIGTSLNLGCQPAEHKNDTVVAVDRDYEIVEPAETAIALPIAGLVECSGRSAIVSVKSESPPCLCRTSYEADAPSDLPTAVNDAIEQSRAYLHTRSMLPPQWRMCANPLNDGSLHVTCWPIGRYLNSPVTLVFKDGRIVNRYYSDTNDLIDGDSNAIETIRELMQRPSTFVLPD